MKKNIILVLLFLAVILPTNLAAQTPNSSYFMKGNFNSFEFNPALVRDSSAFYLALPSAATGVNLNGFSLQQTLTANNQFSPVLLAESLDGSLDILNYNRFNIIGFGWRKGKNRYNFSVNSTVQLKSTLGGGLFDLLAYGNAQYVGSTLDLGGFGVDALAYTDYDFSFSRRFSKKFTAGITVKYLTGIASVQSEKFDLGLYIPNDVSKMSLNTDIIYNVATPVDVSNDITRYPNGEIKGFNEDFEPEVSLSGPTGWAFGFGAVYKITDKFEVAASIQDIGSINWKENAYQVTAKGSYDIDAVDFSKSINEDANDYEEFSDQVDGIMEDFDDAIDFRDTETSFKTTLPLRYYLSANYNLNKTFSVGALYNGVKVYDVDMSSFMGSVNMTILRGISLAGTYSSFSSGVSSYGMGFSLRLAPIQVYVHADNMQDIFKPAELSHVNFRVGANIAFGRKVKKDPFNTNVYRGSIYELEQDMEPTNDSEMDTEQMDEDAEDAVEELMEETEDSTDDSSKDSTEDNAEENSEE